MRTALSVCLQCASIEATSQVSLMRVATNQAERPVNTLTLSQTPKTPQHRQTTHLFCDPITTRQSYEESRDAFIHWRTRMQRFLCVWLFLLLSIARAVFKSQASTCNHALHSHTIVCAELFLQSWSSAIHITITATVRSTLSPSACIC